eukprot:5098286-Amphidinium_carterae.3
MSDDCANLCFSTPPGAGSVHQEMDILSASCKSHVAQKLHDNPFHSRWLRDLTMEGIEPNPGPVPMGGTQRILAVLVLRMPYKLGVALLPSPSKSPSPLKRRYPGATPTRSCGSLKQMLLFGNEHTRDRYIHTVAS